MIGKRDLFEVIKKKGVMRASELAPYTTTGAQLRRYVEAGKLTALSPGYYAHPSLDPLTASLVVVARYYPRAVISNIAALVVHGLSDERLDQIDIDIPRTTSIRNKLLRVHRVNKKLITGAIRHDYKGHKILVYSRERALCDAYRIDSEGGLFLKAFKRYLKTGTPDPNSIAKFDRLMRTNVLRSLTQEMADA